MTQEREERLIGLCRELLRLPSLSGQEEAVARHIQRTMEAYGFDRAEIDRCGSVVGTIQAIAPVPRC